MPEPEATPAQAAKSYHALLWHDIKSRKSEFFVGLLLSILCSVATVWLQYRDGMLEQKHFWDGIVTSAVPVLGIVVIFALVEVYRAAASLHREAQTEIVKLQAARPESNKASSVAELLEASNRHENRLAGLGAQLSSKDKKIAVLEAQIAIDHPRDIPQDKRIRIAERFRAGIPPSETDRMKSQALWVVSLTNSPDTQYLARAIADVLRPYFKVTVDHEFSGRISHRYTQDDLRGLVLMLPAPPKFTGAHNQYRDEYHQQYARCIIDAFGTEGIEIRQERASRFPKVSFIMLLVGGKA
jgi:hypothetical protein